MLCWDCKWKEGTIENKANQSRDRWEGERERERERGRRKRERERVKANEWYANEKEKEKSMESTLIWGNMIVKKNKFFEVLKRFFKRF